MFVFLFLFQSKILNILKRILFVCQLFATNLIFFGINVFSTMFVSYWWILFVLEVTKISLFQKDSFSLPNFWEETHSFSVHCSHHSLSNLWLNFGGSEATVNFEYSKVFYYFIKILPEDKWSPIFYYFTEFPC